MPRRERTLDCSVLNAKETSSKLQRVRSILHEVRKRVKPSQTVSFPLPAALLGYLPAPISVQTGHSPVRPDVTCSADSGDHVVTVA